jgi:predicted kinase
MRNGYDVVIDNTNIQFAHYARYIELANRFEYAVQIVTLLVPPEVGFLRNTHGVPKHTIERLARSLFESIQEKDHDS